MNFWDTSALIAAIDAREVGHARAGGFLRQRVDHAASGLILPESVATVTRRLKPDASAIEAACVQVNEALDRMDLVAVSESLLRDSAALARRHEIKGADAVHLAAAMHLRRGAGKRGFVFLTLDRELAGAARREGLRIILP